MQLGARNTVAAFFRSHYLEFSIFHYEVRAWGKNCMFQGIQPGGLQMLKGHLMSKCLHMAPLGPYPMMLATDQYTKLKMTLAFT